MVKNLKRQLKKSSYSVPVTTPVITTTTDPITGKPLGKPLGTPLTPGTTGVDTTIGLGTGPNGTGAGTGWTADQYGIGRYNTGPLWEPWNGTFGEWSRDPDYTGPTFYTDPQGKNYFNGKIAPGWASSLGGDNTMWQRFIDTMSAHIEKSGNKPYRAPGATGLGTDYKPDVATTGVAGRPVTTTPGTPVTTTNPISRDPTVIPDINRPVTTNPIARGADVGLPATGVPATGTSTTINRDLTIDPSATVKPVATAANTLASNNLGRDPASPPAMSAGLSAPGAGIFNDSSAAPGMSLPLQKAKFNPRQEVGLKPMGAYGNLGQSSQGFMLDPQKFADGGRVQAERGYADGGRTDAWNSVLGGRSIRGSLGDVVGRIITKEELDKLPDWVKKQFQARYDNDDNGQRLVGYEAYDLRDQQGKPVRILNEGNMAGDPRHNNNWNDPAALRYDPDFGMVTSPENMTDVPDASFTNGLRAVQIAIAAAGGYAAYIAATGAAGAAAAAEVGITSEATAAAAAGTGTAGTGAAATGTVGAGVGTTAAGVINMGPIAVTAPSLAGGAGLTGAQLAGGALTAAQVAQLAQNPQARTQARNSGQSVEDWLSNPQNVMSLARAAGGIYSLFAGGNSNSDIGLLPETGTGTPGTGVPGTGAPATNNPAWAGRPAGGAARTPTDTSYLDELDPNAFMTTADLSRWNEARGRFKPVEDMIIGDALKAGSPAEQEAAAGRAGADTEQAYFHSDKQARDRMIAQGLNPDTGGAGMEQARLSALDKNKALAGGKNIARLSEKKYGDQLRLSTAGLGATLSGQGLQADSLVTNTEAANNARRQAVTDHRVDIRSRVGLDDVNRWSREQEAEYQRIYGSGENAANRGATADIARMNDATRRAEINARIARDNANARRQGTIDTGAGIDRTVRGAGDLYNFGRSVFGGGSSSANNYGSIDPTTSGWWDAPYADGGRVNRSDVGLGTDMESSKKKRVRRDYRDGARVKGPGTGTSDSIRARVSDGEGVFNEEAMEMMDAEQPGSFDQMNERGLALRRLRKEMAEQIRTYRPDPSEVGL